MSSTNGLGNLEKHTQYSKIGTLCRSTHRNYLKMDQRLNIRTETIKLLEENIRKKLIDIGLCDDFLI